MNAIPIDSQLERLGEGLKVGRARCSVGRIHLLDLRATLHADHRLEHDRRQRVALVVLPIEGSHQHAVRPLVKPFQLCEAQSSLHVAEGQLLEACALLLKELGLGAVVDVAEDSAVNRVGGAA